MEVVWLIIAVIALIGIYIGFFTPYPFVWLLRSKHEEKENKAPNSIESLKANINIEEDLHYSTKFSRNEYDLFYPKAKQNIKGLVLWVHGGSFIAGDKIGMRNYGILLANQDYLVVGMNYQYAPSAHFPAQIKQIDDCLAYLKEELPKHLDIALPPIFIGGDSAGANLVAEYGAIVANSTLAAQIKLKPCLKAANIKGLLLYCGPYDFSEDINNPKLKAFKTFMKYIGWAYLGKKQWMKHPIKTIASPISGLNKDYPPAYVVDGNAYSFMWQGKKFVEVLRANAVYVVERFFDGEEKIPHEFQFNYQKYSAPAQIVLDESLAFMQECLNR